MTADKTVLISFYATKINPKNKLSLEIPVEHERISMPNSFVCNDLFLTPGIAER